MNSTYSDLCEELEVSESEMDKFIETESLYMFEKISKLLRVPLYSFYRTPKNNDDKPSQRYYTNDLWED